MICSRFLGVDTIDLVLDLLADQVGPARRCRGLSKFRGCGRSTLISRRMRPGCACSTMIRSASRTASPTECVTNRIVLCVCDPQLLELLVQQRARLRVQRRERLVHQQHRRVHHQRPGDRDALPHAAGQLVDQLLAAVRRGGPCAARSATRSRRSDVRHAGHLQAELDVLRGREPGEQAVVLEDHRPVGAGAVDGLAVERRRCRASGLIMPAAMLSSVLLPQPLGPTTTTNSPGSQVRLTSRSAWTVLPAEVLVDRARGTSRPRACARSSADRRLRDAVAACGGSSASSTFSCEPACLRTGTARCDLACAGSSCRSSPSSFAGSFANPSIVATTGPSPRTSRRSGSSVNCDVLDRRRQHARRAASCCVSANSASPSWPTYACGSLLEPLRSTCACTPSTFSTTSGCFARNSGVVMTTVRTNFFSGQRSFSCAITFAPVSTIRRDPHGSGAHAASISPRGHHARLLGVGDRHDVVRVLLPELAWSGNAGRRCPACCRAAASRRFLPFRSVSVVMPESFAATISTPLAAAPAIDADALAAALRVRAERRARARCSRCRSRRRTAPRSATARR